MDFRRLPPRPSGARSANLKMRARSVLRYSKALIWACFPLIPKLTCFGRVLLFLPSTGARCSLTTNRVCVHFTSLGPSPNAHREDRKCKQYLAVGPLPSKSYMPSLGEKRPIPSAACIQIWSYGSSHPDEDGESYEHDRGVVACEMVLCIESGHSENLKWCPLPSNDSVSLRLQSSHRCIPTTPSGWKLLPPSSGS